MTLQEKIAAILDGPVFDGELYYIQHPDTDGTMSAVAKTYAVFSIVGGQSFNTLEGDTGISQPRVQVSIYTVDALELIAKVVAVTAAMRAANELTETVDVDTTAEALFNRSASVPVDGFEQETRRYYSHCDFYCWN